MENLDYEKNELTYSEITFKASHNSYERKEEIIDQLNFNPENPSNGACLSLEFDIWRTTSAYEPDKSINENFFRVYHTSPHVWPPLGKTLKYYLEKITEWHKSNTEHNVTLITLDIKSTEGGYDKFHDEIDTYLKTFFSEELIFKPSNLASLPGETLCEKIVKNNWPTLKNMKGKFIFCLSGNKDWKLEYTMHELLTDRLCFSDLDKPDNDKNVTPPNTGNIVFFNFNIFQKNRGIWANTIPKFATKNLITRAYVVDSEANWKCCLQANVSAIATNKIRDAEWAKVAIGNENYTPKYKSIDKRFLQNKANSEYRTNKSTQMRDTFKAPECIFIFEKQEGNNIYALKNAYNNEYLDCTISTMSSKIIDNCQKWELIPVKDVKDEYYIKNVQNQKYLTKRASKLADGCGNDEVYMVRNV